jgi:excisionase family DNA binding protein
LNADYFSIEQAAERLGVSSATVRRRIRRGEIQAVKQPGPYGEQYYIPADEINTAQMITNVVPVVKQLDALELAETIGAAIRKENEELRQEMRELRQQLADLKKVQEEREQERDFRIVAQIRAVMEEKKQPWWTRLFWKNKGV